jgi:hypothetical protein
MGVTGPEGVDTMSGKDGKLGRDGLFIFGNPGKEGNKEPKNDPVEGEVGCPLPWVTSIVIGWVA